MTKVSVVMPAHNAAKTIKESINSVISQTFTDWELLVINDSSTDDTETIVSEYVQKDTRIKLLHTDKSVGKPFYPRNVGIQAASGRIIAFLDSDDVWLPTKLENQLPLFEDNDTAITFSYYEKFSTVQNESNKNRVIKSPETVSFKNALYGNPIGNLTGMYDTQKVGKIFYEDAGHEDYILWLTILKKGFIAKNTNTVEARYRVAEKSVSSNKGKAALWTWNIYRKTLGFNLFKASFCYALYMFKGVSKFLK
ncbi:glycosyltransferase family 2 protein [Treponema sp.]|uniref:glycosyltransferase family 2 protein n=1 Tax=Treponema sp. TaxID=166 RepID=UPI0025CD490E|nr:glycosyltransferase family 2 protein [Treponema sp.]MBR4320888.1 glycosyltransferase family 2 protein [Treponema sp.]